jgi:hypothetical protein
MRTRLEQLAAFCPIFRDSKTVFGNWHFGGGRGTQCEPLTMPWFELGEVGSRFVQMAYDSGWVIGGFDWPEWANGPEGQDLLGNRKAVSVADSEQLAKLLTVLIRQDRFDEGSLTRAFESGLLLAIAERAGMLVSDPSLKIE